MTAEPSARRPRPSPGSVAFAAAGSFFCLSHACAAGPVEPELLLTLSMDLSTEPGNRVAVVVRLQRNELLTAGDRIDVLQRISRLRKEFAIDYAAPMASAGFTQFSAELNLAETTRYLDRNRTLRTEQASVRNLWSRPAPLGTWGLGWGAESLRIDPATANAPYLADYVQRQGTSSRPVPLYALWSHGRHGRDESSVLPNGQVSRLTLEVGTPAGNIRYRRLDVQHESNVLLTPRMAAGIALGWGYVRGSGGDLTPIGKRYFGGGVGSVRGYEAGALSPTDASGAATGANRRARASAEMFWHAFDAGATPIVLSAFADYGRFAGMDSSLVPRAEATAYGLGVSLPASIGLVRFSFARPTNAAFRTQHFQFDARATW